MADDVLFEDMDICILRPDSKRGVLIFTNAKTPAVCKEGLKTHEALGRAPRKMTDPDHDKLIYFRAPYRPDVSSFEASYGNTVEAMAAPMFGGGGTTIVVLRIDPEKTFVYSSEARIKLPYAQFLQTRIPFTDYLKRIAGHAEMPYSNAKGEVVWGNILTYAKEYRPSMGGRMGFHTDPFRQPSSATVWEEGTPVERMAEVVAKLPHIPPTWFVECHTGEAPAGPPKASLSELPARSFAIGDRSSEVSRGKGRQTRRRKKRTLRRRLRR
jgi:hypothetical protein